MRFNEVIGNESLKEALARMKENNHLGHAIILNEENGGGGFAIALALAQYVNCKNPMNGESCGTCSSCHKYGKLIHPDLHFVFPVSNASFLSESEKKTPVSDYFLDKFKELSLVNPYFTEQELYDALELESKNSNIGVYEAKSITSKLALKSSEGDYKTMIIFLPEKMNQDAANKLLKLIEEPSDGTLFIMVCHSPEKLLQTIKSRCQMFSLVPLSRDERKTVMASSTWDDSRLMEITVSILKAGLSKSIIDMFPQWEALANLGREKQKEFCIYAESLLRKLMMHSKGLDNLAYCNEKEESVVQELSEKIGEDFYEKAFNAFESALSAIDNNVSSKLNFCDLCNKILLYL